MTFIDDIRDLGKETWPGTISYGGFDPDLHDSGLATVTYLRSSHGRRRLYSVRLETFSIHKDLKDLAAANAMIDVMSASREAFLGDETYVEGEQLYPREAHNAAKMIAMGNDLIHLAHVAGAARTLFALNRCDVTIVRPATWKGQRDKPTMHLAAAQLLQQENPILTVNGQSCESVVGLNIHVLDALCMALRLGGERV